MVITRRKGGEEVEDSKGGTNGDGSGKHMIQCTDDIIELYT